MKFEDAEEYTQSLGQIIAGSWRQIALAHRLGVPVALGYKGTDGLRQWVQERLGGYVKMEVTERKEAVVELKHEGHSNREIAAFVGVDESTVREDMSAGNPADDEKDDAEIKGSDVTHAGNPAPLDAIPAVQKTRAENERKRKAELEAAPEIVLPPGLHFGDFRKLAHQIPDNSVQLIFTDPPYDENSIDLYRDAAAIAARILKRGGSFIAYSGQRHLPSVLQACGHHLDYWWTIAGVHSGGSQVLNKLGIRCGWKPLIWFVKNTRGDVANIISDIVSGGREKDGHEWQQSQSEAEYYISELTSEGGLVVDFFSGSGTTKAAAEKLGRQCIAFEVDKQTAEKSAPRLTLLK